MLDQIQKMAVAADDAVGEAIGGGGDVDVVGRIGGDDTAGHFALHKRGDSAERVDPEIEILLLQTEILPDPGITEAASQFVESGGRGDQLEGVVTQETNEEPARRPFGPDQAADHHVRVEDGAHGRL